MVSRPVVHRPALDPHRTYRHGSYSLSARENWQLWQERHASEWRVALLLAAVLVAALVMVLATRPAGAHPYTAEDTRAAVYAAAAETGVSAAWLYRVVKCETAHTWNPYSVGDGGLSEGAAQLHLYGLRSTFYRWGFTDHWNPYQAVSFMAHAFKAGLAYLWSCK